MDVIKAVAIFLYHSDFVSSMNLCLNYNLDVTDFIVFTFDTILFYDAVQFVFFLGHVSNTGTVSCNNFIWRILSV
jgi:hypothetical protein